MAALRFEVLEVAAGVSRGQFAARVTVRPRPGEGVECGAAQFFFHVTDGPTAAKLLDRWRAFCRDAAAGYFTEVGPVVPAFVLEIQDFDEMARLEGQAHG